MTEYTSGSNLLPVITHMLEVYKEWYACRDSLPKKSRYTLGDRIDTYFIKILETLYTASYQTPNEKTVTLQRAASAIDTLKFLLQITWELRAIDNKRYASLSDKIQKIGREVGGWRKGLQTKTAPH